MQLKKRYIVILISILAVVAFRFLTRSREYPLVTEGDFIYRRHGSKEAEVIQYIGQEKEVVLPETLGGYVVTRLCLSVFRETGVIEKMTISQRYLEVTTSKSRNDPTPFALTMTAQVEQIINYIYLSVYYIEVENGNASYASIDGVLFNREPRKT
jgi:hypothetical protein